MYGGVIDMPKTLEANVKERLQKQSLTELQLPDTFKHAITLVQDMGEQYLWIDALCIVQGNLVQIQRDIPRMDFTLRPFHSLHLSQPCSSTVQISELNSIMGIFVHPPFALFDLVDLPYRGTCPPHAAKGEDNLERTNRLSTTLSKKPTTAVQSTSGTSTSPSQTTSMRHGLRDQATKAPIPETFKSPFVGQSIESLAEWLRKKPEDVNLETKFFAVLDRKAKDGKVVLVRIADDHEQKTKPSCVLIDTKKSSLRG